jgi:hypothetical protein
MATMIVRSDGLNLRRKPTMDPATIQAALPFAHPVSVLEGQPGATWWRVRTVVGQQHVDGWVAARFLRQPASDPRERLIGRATAEWFRFDRGKGKESTSPYSGYIGEYWRAIGINLDGTNTSQPWSAAYISYVVRKAGYGTSFVYSDGHWRYINDAITKRESNGDAAPFWGFRLNEHRPQIGDLVAGWRESPVEFDSRPNGHYPSHCDVVVDVTPTTISTLGGNVANSVAMKTFLLDANGFLAPQGQLFAILRNNK